MSTDLNLTVFVCIVLPDPTQLSGSGSRTHLPRIYESLIQHIFQDPDPEHTCQEFMRACSNTNFRIRISITYQEFKRAGSDTNFRIRNTLAKIYEGLIQHNFPDPEHTKQEFKRA
jgi:hypothetical protein